VFLYFHIFIKFNIPTQIPLNNEKMIFLNGKISLKYIIK